MWPWTITITTNNIELGEGSGWGGGGAHERPTPVSYSAAAGFLSQCLCYAPIQSRQECQSDRIFLEKGGSCKGWKRGRRERERARGLKHSRWRRKTFPNAITPKLHPNAILKCFHRKSYLHLTTAKNVNVFKWAQLIDHFIKALVLRGTNAFMKFIAFFRCTISLSRWRFTNYTSN